MSSSALIRALDEIRTRIDALEAKINRLELRDVKPIDAPRTKLTLPKKD